MKSKLSTVLLGALFAVALAVPALAYDNQQAAIALHIVPATPGNACGITGLTSATMHVSEPNLSTPSGPFYYVYLLVCNGSDSTGIQGMEMGIDYQGAYAPEGGALPISVYSWTLCATLEFPFAGVNGPWPNPMSNNLITWSDDRCNKTQSEPGVPRTVIAIGGYFYMGAYGDATMSVIPRPVSGFAKVADCSAAENDITNMVPSHLGVAGFGTAVGYSPCGLVTPVKAATWSGVKTMYNK